MAQPILLYFCANFGNSQQKETWNERPGSTFSWVQTPVDSSRLYRSLAVINRCWLLDGERRPRSAERGARRLPLKGPEMGRLIKAALRLMLFMLVGIWTNPTLEMSQLCGRFTSTKGIWTRCLFAERISFVKETFYTFFSRLFFFLMLYEIVILEATGTIWGKCLYIAM